MRICMECQPRALFPLLLVEDLPTEPPIIPLQVLGSFHRPKLQRTLPQTSLGWFWTWDSFLNAGHRYYLITSTTVFFFKPQMSEISRSQWVLVILFLHYNLPCLTFQSVSHVFDSRYAQALGTLFKLVFLWKTPHGECENRGFPFQPLNQPRKIRPSKRRISGRLQGDVWAITWWCGTAKLHSPMIGGKYLELKMPARGLFLDWKFVVWPSFWRVDLQRSFGF